VGVGCEIGVLDGDGAAEAFDCGALVAGVKQGAIEGRVCLREHHEAKRGGGNVELGCDER